VDRRRSGGPRQHADLSGDGPCRWRRAGRPRSRSCGHCRSCCPNRSTWSRTVPVHKDCMVHFEGRTYPFRSSMSAARWRSAALSGRVQILDPQTAVVLRFVRPGTPGADLDRSVLLRRPRHGGGGSAKPLGRMARKLQEIASLPVEQRPMDLYARAGGGGPMTPRAECGLTRA